MFSTQGTRPLSWYAEQAPDKLWEEEDEQLNSDERRKSMKRQFFIAGVQFRPAGDIRIAGAKLKVGDKLLLFPEPTNRFDPNAVQLIYKNDKLEIPSMFLGYVPKKYSSEVSGLLSIGAPVECIVDEVNPSAKTYEMFKVTVRLPIDEEESAKTEEVE